MSEGLQALARELHKEQSEIDALVKTAAGNAEAVKLLVDGLTFPVETYRYNCNLAIVEIAQMAPQEVYPYWNLLTELLESSNTYHRCSAINILPHLIPADRHSRFDGVFEKLFRHLDDQSVIPPCYLARNCPTIVSHRPDLTQRVVDQLLAIDATGHKPGRKDLIKADIIAALNRMYDHLENRTEVQRFVEAQLDSSSPKTRKAAKAFLDKQRDS